MRDPSPEVLLAARREGEWTRAVIDSREAGPGDLFVGLPGANVDGARFVDDALRQGAFAAITGLEALQTLATAWRRELGAKVVGVTGSTGKTSTKDVLAAMLAQRLRTVATAQNLNTEIGLPLTVLAAPAGTEALVLEMAMRGRGQIAELAAIAEPDVGIITNVGPVHLELLGSVEAIAHTKAELLDGLPPGGTAVVPEGERLLESHRRDDLVWTTFGPGGDVAELPEGLDVGFTSAHMRLNAMAALAAARAVGVEPTGRLEVALSGRRGQRRTTPAGVTVVDDCYNANPMSMRAALDDLAATAPGRKVAVLGDMLELGPEEGRLHQEIGAHARETASVDVLVTVGPRAQLMRGDAHVDDAAAAARLVPTLLRGGDTVLVKASRGVGLEAVVEAIG